MHDVGAVLIILTFIIGAAVVTWAWWRFIGRGMEARQARRERLALHLNPLYRAKVEEDRRYQLAWANIALQRERLYLGTNKVSEVTPTPAQIASPHVRQPSMYSLLQQLEPGALQVCPGVRADTGEPVILSIEDAVHFKLIGSSGFGKSCEAAALLEQAITLNGPEVLQIALLDLEHKTSRLFEDSPNVAVLQVGKRHVPMVATTADEVALYLGYLKSELDRRARLSESDLQYAPVLLMYVEEMLALRYEVDEKLMGRMLADLSVLAVRARKYRMFLLACTQTDYSTPELRTAQKQFRTRIAYAIDITAARAAGFMSTDLIKQNFTTSQKGDGQFVLESPGIAALMLAPVYDVKQKLLAKERSTSVQERFTPPALSIVNTSRSPSERQVNGDERTRAAEVLQLRSLGWGKQAIIEKLWQVKKGGTKGYQVAEAEYEQIMSQLEEA
jgi:hypothetical protein